MLGESRIYLDYNATTPTDKRVAEAAFSTLLDISGNPSSIHAEGRKARGQVEKAREQVAQLLAARASDVIFTSGGTEADLLGMVGLARQGSGATFIATTTVDHPAILGAARALASGQLAHKPGRHCIIPVDCAARVAVDALDAIPRGPGVLALSLANHEFGTVQNVRALTDRAHAKGLLVHLDAVQAAGKIPIDVNKLGADTLAVSAHKFYGPTGVGALWIRPGLHLEPLAEAGHQERDRRPGTENTAGIVAMGVASELALKERLADHPRIVRLTQALQAGLEKIADAVVHGEGEGVGNTICVSFPGAPGDAVVQGLDLAGVAISTGAACTSGSVAPSPVVLGANLGEELARTSVRFSLGCKTNESAVERTLTAVSEIVARVRQFS